MSKKALVEKNEVFSPTLFFVEGSKLYKHLTACALVML